MRHKRATQWQGWLSTLFIGKPQIAHTARSDFAEANLILPGCFFEVANTQLSTKPTLVFTADKNKYLGNHARIETIASIMFLKSKRTGLKHGECAAIAIKSQVLSKKIVYEHVLVAHRRNAHILRTSTRLNQSVCVRINWRIEKLVAARPMQHPFSICVRVCRPC